MHCLVADSTDIVDGKMKLILGLMWTLILHYSISMPMWDGDEFGDQTPKQRLLQWIQSRVPDKPINNFTTDWNDGTAVGALVDAVAPGVFRLEISSITWERCHTYRNSAVAELLLTTR